MTTPAPTPSLLQVVWDHVAARASLATPHAFIALLAALSGRTGRPVSVGLTGNDATINTIIETLRELLGDHHRFISSATEAGLIALDGSPKVGTLIIDGVRDSAALTTIERIARRLPVARLDADNKAEERYRQLRRPMACVLCRAEETQSEGLVTDLIQLHVAETKLHIRSRLNAGLWWLDSAGHQIDTALCEGAAALRPLLDGINWSARPSILHIQTVLHEIPCSVAFSRFAQVMSLATVVAMLNRLPGPGAKAVQVYLEEIDYVLMWLRTAEAEDHRRALSPGAVGFLRVLQRINRCSTSNSGAGGSGGLTNVTGSSVAPAPPCPITCYDVQTEPEYAAYSIDSIRRWFSVLESAGVVEKSQSISRRHAWALTTLGCNHGASSLADLVEPYIERLKELQQQGNSNT